MDEISAELLVLSELSESIELSPYEKWIIEQAREIEDVLNLVKKMPEEFDSLKTYQDEMIRLMDEQCPYIGEEVIVSGDVIIPIQDKGYDRFSLDHTTLVDGRLMSMGFKALSVEDSNGYRREVVGHIFVFDTLRAVDRNVPLVDYIPRRYAFAPVGSIEIAPNTSLEEDDVSLREAIPELMAKIDVVLDNNSDPLEAIRQLSATVLTPGIDLPRELVDILQRHVGSRLHFDLDVPYYVELEGAISTHNVESNEIYQPAKDDTHKPGRLVAWPGRIWLLSYGFLNDKATPFSEDLHWMLEFTVMGNTQRDPVEHFIAPIRNIKSMMSVRDL